MKRRFVESYSSYCNLHSNDDISPFYISWSEMLDCISNIKSGKATGSFVKPQHFYSGSPKLILHMHLLFNGLIQHGYVPSDFLCGTISPVVKDNSGDIFDSTNYRPITLSSLPSQLFEHAVLIKIDHLLSTDDLQFGFKKKHSTSHALFVLKEAVDYFTKHSSNVFVTFLDCSMAFDKISHSGLFLKLMERGVPLCILNVLIYLFSSLKSRCRWKDEYSGSFQIPSGIKQGGIISPRLFIVYIDKLITLLRKKGVGCHILNIFLACIMFADDLALLAPTQGVMQDLIIICETFCREACLSFNTAKTKTLIFGSRNKLFDPAPLILNNAPIEYVPEWKYLGCLIQAGKQFSFSSKNDLRSFYCSTNSILSVLKKPNEQVSLRLLFTNCVPILTYASEVKSFSASEMTQCNVALNNAIRKIFSYQ